MRIGCVVMAAGNAQRFGSNKLLAVINGKPMIQRAFDAIPSSLFDTVTVVTQYEEIAALAAARGYDAVINRHPDWGISHTIQLGLEGMGNMDAVMFLVSDQPLLQRESVEALLTFYLQQPEKISALAHDGVRGNPCVFPAPFFPALLALQGDVGGGTVIKDYPDALRLMEVPLSQLQDIDTVQQLDILRE